jgi:hypothetical protein
MDLMHFHVCFKCICKDILLKYIVNF